VLKAYPERYFRHTVLPQFTIFDRDTFHGIRRFLVVFTIAYLTYNQNVRRYSEELLSSFPNFSFGKVKAKLVPLLNQLSTLPRRRVREWRYTSTILDHGTRGRWWSTPYPLRFTSKGKTSGTNRTSESVWTLQRRENVLSYRESKSGRLARGMLLLFSWYIIN
jgi:hypothetical protein